MKKAAGANPLPTSATGMKKAPSGHTAQGFGSLHLFVAQSLADASGVLSHDMLAPHSG